MSIPTSLVPAATGAGFSDGAQGLRRLLTILVAGGALASQMALASAIQSEPTVTFNFDVLDNTTNVNGMKLSNSLYGNGVGKAASPAAISSYMTTLLHLAGYANSSVTVTGALGTASYVGEGYVWGNSLGSSNGAVSADPNVLRPNRTTTPVTGHDGFLINDNFGDFSKKSSEIVMQFNNFVVDSISYDWEIFPDNTCPNSSARSCPSTPDMSLWANGKPVPGGAFSSPRRMVPDASNSRVYAPQLLGTISDPLLLNAATLLEFRDWPAEIGIDNLKIKGHVVPEPASLPLLGAGLLAIGWLGRRRRQA